MQSPIRPMANPFRRARFAAPLLLAAACAAVGPDHVAPEVALPAAFQGAGGTAPFVGGEEAQDLTRWWARFGDPTLTALVERALSDGLDVQSALERLAEARALRGIAASERVPSLEGRFDYAHARESENTPFGPFAPETDIHSLGIDAAWELDLWGRVRRAVEAADRDLEVSGFEAQAVAVSIAAETALRYIELRAFQRRLELARVNVSLQEQTLAIVSSRRDAGLVGELDVAQAAANLESTRALVPVLEIGLRAAQNRLAVLVGVAPGADPELAASLAGSEPVPAVPTTIAVGVPADLLRRRPDVRRAERAYAAEVARIGVAEAERYPRLSLLGTLGLASDGLADLLESDSATSSFGPSVRWSLFDGGRLRASVDAQRARARQAELAWEATVLVAVEEAENALTALTREQERRAALSKAAAESRRASEVARSQYTAGLTDFQAVLVSERATAALEDELAVSDAAVTSAVVSLFKALGGGFGDEPRLAAARGGLPSGG